MGLSGQGHAPAALYPGERTPGTHCTGGLVGPRDGLDTEVRGKISCLCQGSKLDRQVAQSIARHYTDWATPAPILLRYKVVFIRNISRQIQIRQTTKFYENFLCGLRHETCGHRRDYRLTYSHDSRLHSHFMCGVKSKQMRVTSYIT
jgi:hypothetical protein